MQLRGNRQRKQVVIGWVFPSVSALRDGPLENLWGAGAGEVQKTYSRKGKFNEEKFLHAS